MTSVNLKHKFNTKPSQTEVDAFVTAAAAGKDALVTQYLKKYGAAIIDKEDALGWTALTDAAACGKKTTVALLLENGADITQKDKEGWTVLMRAVWNRHKPVVKILLEKGVPYGEKNNEGKTVMMMARKRDKPEITLLLEKEPAKRAHAARLKAEQEARELAEDIADYSPALKQDVRVSSPFKLPKRKV